MDDDSDLRTTIRDFRASVAEKFAQQDARLDGIDGRLDGIDGRLDGIDGRLDEFAHEFRERTRTMETAILNSIRDLSSSIHRRVDDHESRIKRLEGDQSA